MSSSTRGKRPTVAILLSLFGGLLILASGAGILIIRTLALSVSLPTPLQGLLGQGYAPMAATGFSHGISYVVGIVADVVPGIIIIACALMILVEPTRASKFGYLIIAFTFVSLAGVGGFFLGFLLGLIGGAWIVLRGRSIPKIAARPPSQRPVVQEQKAA